MKTIAEQYFDLIIKDCFQATLKPLGFKKKGNNFYRQLADLGQIINVQKSAYYSKDHIKFTINIGLFIPEYWLVHFNYHDGIVPDFPTEPVCAIRIRIGKLRYGIDKWFDVNQFTDILELKNETIENLEHYIIPYFERSKTKADIVKLLDDETTPLTHFLKLIILGEYKEFERAQEEYNRLRQDSYVSRNMNSVLLEYRDKYRLTD